jgi:hypothetical protein
MRPLPRLAALGGVLGIVLGLAAPACAPEDAAPAPPPEETPAPPFMPLPAGAYTAKVKDLLTGEPPTSAEVEQVRADPAALGRLIDGWMETPAFTGKLLHFFQQAFQQTQVGIEAYDAQLGFTTQPWYLLHQLGFRQSAEYSFALTAWQLMQEGRPFTDVLTTERFVLNPPLMGALSFMDAVPIDDEGQPVASKLWILWEEPTFSFTRQTKGGPIPLADSLNRGSPNYLKFYDPNPYGSYDVFPECKEDPYVQRGGAGLLYLFYFVYGGRPGCVPTLGLFTGEDYGAWRMVTIRRPREGERRVRFYDVPALRAAKELLLEAPRVGFMTTPAFFANWPTNSSNLARVTANQAMIVGLGKSFDDTSVTVQVSETADDAAHAKAGTTCYGCHQTLDPMRNFFRQSYTVSYHSQYDFALSDLDGTFALDGVVAKGRGIKDLAQAMAAHPRFAAAWAQKICRWANSSDCVPDDPELLRVADAFAKSGFRFKTLLRELLSSPLVTFAAPTKTARELGLTVSIRRREHLCASLQSRLGIPDACSTAGFYFNDPPRQKARGLAMAVPGDGYARGAEAPLLPRDASLFSQSSAENLCALLADQVVDAPPPAKGRYESADPEAALRDIVATVMGLPPGDERAGPALGIVRDHYKEALAGGAAAGDALKSAFVLGCASPFALSTGL